MAWIYLERNVYDVQIESYFRVEDSKSGRLS